MCGLFCESHTASLGFVQEVGPVSVSVQNLLRMESFGRSWPRCTSTHQPHYPATWATWATWVHRLRLVQTKIEEAMRGQNVSALRLALSEGQVASGQTWTLPPRWVTILCITCILYTIMYRVYRIEHDRKLIIHSYLLSLRSLLSYCWPKALMSALQLSERDGCNYEMRIKS